MTIKLHFLGAQPLGSLGLNTVIQSGCDFFHGLLSLSNMRLRSLLCLPRRSPQRRVLTHQSLPSTITNFQYAVRGVLLQRAEELERQLASGKHNLPFDHIVYCNIGNPQQLGQKGLTWIAQGIAFLYIYLKFTPSSFSGSKSCHARTPQIKRYLPH